MKKNNRAKKGQFSVIAALLVSVILVTAVISTYTMVRHAPLQDSPQVLTAIGEMNSDIKRILDFTVGYYCSILRVTGNSSYARELTTTYLSNGLVNIAHSHPEWNPSFELHKSDSEPFSTCWFMPNSYSMGKINITYSLSALGIEGVNFQTFSSLDVEMLNSSSGIARINVTRDNSEPELGLTKDNFWFYNYSYSDSKWELINPTDVLISYDGVYTMSIPNGVNHDAYSVHIEDSRGLIVPVFYSLASVASEEKIPHYTYHFDWNSTGMIDIYKSLDTDTFAIEVLQNGTLRWLGQPLDLMPGERPIPPVSIKAFRINATVGLTNKEVPFQIEDWTSDYMVPLGLSNNESIFSNDNMLVFLVNNTVSEITLWWDGNDATIQTPFAWRNVYFNDDIPNSSLSWALLNNGLIELHIEKENNLRVNSYSVSGPATCDANFLRVNNQDPQCGSGPSFIISNGIVRDIVQHEPEYSGGVLDCYDFYAHVFITFPACSTYYTYSVRTIFINTNQVRDIFDLSVIQISDLDGTPMTEDGTVGPYPNPSNLSVNFYDSFPTGWDHHWSQFVSENAGVGVMFTNSTNERLYSFDALEIVPTGAIVVDELPDNLIEVNPVELDEISFTNAREITWYGAVVTFSEESIYRNGDDVGLWVMVEYPPAVTLDGYATANVSNINYVDSSLSNVDSSYDKGSHSAFAAQKYGPDDICDTLTEEEIGTVVYENSAQSSSGTSSSSHSFNYALQKGSGNDRLIVVTVSWEDQQASASVSSLTFNGIAMTPITDVTVGTGYSEFVSLWYLLDSSLPSSPGSYNIALTTSETITREIYIAVAEYSGAQQSAPDDFDTDTNAASGDIAITLTAVKDGSLVVAGVGEGGTNILTNTNNIDVLQSDILDSSGSALGHHTNVASGDITVGWNNLDTREAIVGAVWQPSSGDFELDLEVQWTHADFDKVNEQLCIYLNSSSGENLLVEIWNETSSSWDSFATLTIGWNNATVSSYLTSPEFTIRFLGETETGDSTQDYWTIDATLLKCWS